MFFLHLRGGGLFFFIYFPYFRGGGSAKVWKFPYFFFKPFTKLLFSFITAVASFHNDKFYSIRLLSLSFHLISFNSFSFFHSSFILSAFLRSSCRLCSRSPRIFILCLLTSPRPRPRPRPRGCVADSRDSWMLMCFGICTYLQCLVLIEALLKMFVLMTHLTSLF